jgi:hypothetical protein
MGRRTESDLEVTSEEEVEEMEVQAGKPDLGQDVDDSDDESYKGASSSGSLSTDEDPESVNSAVK